MEIIQQIGSYAGLAAVLGLAILAALYFSQARDVKRLREWAGRVPERAPVPYQPPRVMAQPRPPSPPPPSPPPQPPGARPAPLQPAAAPASAGATPAVARGPVAATPAAARAGEGGAESDRGTQNTVAHPPPRVLPPPAAPPGLGGHFAREAQIAGTREEAERAGTEAGGGDREPAAEAASDEPDRHAGERPADTAQGNGEPQDEPGEQEDELPGHEEAAYDPESDADLAGLPDPEDFHEGDDLVEEPVLGEERASTPPPPPPITATRPPLPPRPAPPPRVHQGPILPPYEHSRPGGTAWEERRISPAKAALAVGGTVLVVAAGAYGVLRLVAQDDGAREPAKSSRAAVDDGSAAPSRKPARPAVDPRRVTVSVLNGTTIGGLAAKLGDRLEGQGFQLGNVTNNTDQQRAESVVLYAPGAEREAKDVGRRLRIDQRELIDPDSQTRAGDARVVVVAGADLE